MGTKKRVVIADRGSELYPYLANYIPLLGAFDVVKAIHPIDALAKINAYKPELLIYNLTLKEARARNIFLAEVRRKHPKTHVLVICDNAQECSDLKAAGITDIMVHPYDLSDLSEKIQCLLPGKELSELHQEEARLLIADDEIEISSLLKEDFTELGIKVFTAKDGREALSVFRDNLCNLALIDLKMPYLNGDELIREMASSVKPPSPKEIILMTAALGDSMPELQRHNMSLIQKPLDTESLQRKILADCERYHLSVGEKLKD